ncbi:hypothetical protein SAMN02745824_3083 [Parasphingorhabdus marina DSM 22363]|uniref:Uncharacterized protein n=1 Tax=Parasphingorhabdus marina DSM 22363 TaxID=1123272 RepID=A0A1N6H0X4_9SPHN|nr:hypothetical protein [Parasphingorhabdus marina]SIO13409.1 hypothetical protein SAMN02745824_3083 [Parasphingorhabdus marina DSM 22363]
MWKIVRVLTIVLMLPLLVLTWLPSNRVPMDGESYAWGLPLLGMDLSGRSINFDWLVVLLFTLLALATLWFLVRGTARQFGWWGCLYFGLFFLSAILMVTGSEEPLVMHGDTLGVEIPLGSLIIGHTGLLWLIALSVLVWHRAPDERPPLTRTNRVLLAVLFLAWCASAVMLRLGGSESQLDQAGVLLLISVALFLPVALLRFNSAEPAQMATA